jgi:hypothetical protein
MERVLGVLVLTLRQHGVAAFVTVPRKKRYEGEMLSKKFECVFGRGIGKNGG